MAPVDCLKSGLFKDLMMTYHVLWDRRHGGFTRISQWESIDVSEWPLSASKPTIRLSHELFGVLNITKPKLVS